MKYTLLSFVCLIASLTVLAQSEERRPSYRHFFDRGSKAINIQLGVAGGYPINSITELDISSNNKRYGLLALPSYGWFVERNLMLGASAIVGFNYNSSSFNSFDYSTNPPRPAEVKNVGSGSDFGVAPFMRYYIPLSRRNVVSLFGQGSLPLIYSRYRYTNSLQTAQGVVSSSMSREEGLKLIGSVGLGVSVNGRFGSFEVNANNTGLYVGFQKYFSPKKK